MPIITDNDTLIALCETLKTEEFITVDTEFLRDKTYFSQLCLIQIGTEKEAFAVDPLADGIDLSPLFAIFNDEPVLKVFHSARQDIEILLGLSGKVPYPLFDTQVAAMVCGFGEAASYETLVSKLAKKAIDKSCRFTDWSQRPLTQNQYHYALSDVIHLREVYRALLSMLEEAGRVSWLEEELFALTNPENYMTLPEEAWKRIKIKSSSPTFIRLVKALAYWREMTARAQNLPRNHLLKEQVLLEMAASAPKTHDELKRIRSLGGLANHPVLSKEILEIIRSANNPHVTSQPYFNDEKKVPPLQSGALVELLKVLLKTVCENHNVAEKLIATTQELCIIAYMSDEEECTNIPALQGWRFEIFGRLALELKEGKIALSALGDKMCIITIAAHQEMQG